MSGAVRVTWARTMGRARNLYVTAFSVAGFLFVAAVLFAYRMGEAEGTALKLPAIWASAAGVVLPVLAAFLGMDVWSDERKSGRIDFLMTTSAAESSLVVGKFLGVWSWVVMSVVLFGGFTIGALAMYASAALVGVGVMSFVPGALMLILQGALWSAVAVCVSAWVRHVAVSAMVSIGLMVALPRGLWALALEWLSAYRTSLGEMILDAQVMDAASGAISIGVILAYVILVVGVLYIGTNVVMGYRLVGRGARGARVMGRVIILLTCVLMVMGVGLVTRGDFGIEVPVLSGAQFSARTRTILAEAHGEVEVTSFLPRRDARWRATSQFMRALEREAAALGGVKIRLNFVEARWDVGAAARLVREGVAEDSLVFTRGRRRLVLPLKDGVSERNCASAILSLTMPPGRRMVYWTKGHGEIGYDDYTAWGMSDMARELAREGYQNEEIDLTAAGEVATDAALVIVAGAKEDFSRTELGKLEAYLRQGGRMLVLMGASGAGGVAQMLPALGMRTVKEAMGAAKTLAGGEVVVNEFSGHAIVAPLVGSQVVFDRPVGFEASGAAVSAGGAGVDRVEFAALAKVGERVVAALVERGAGTGEDLALRPMRIAAIGDATFVMNGQLAVRSNANRDFFLNCVAYLSGTDALLAGGLDAGQFATGMDDGARRKFAVVYTFGTAGSVWIVMMMVACIRRRQRR